MMLPGIGFYLCGIAAVALETSRDLRLLPEFLAILKLAPGTVAELRRDASRRLAA